MKKQENVTHNQEKEQSIEAESKRTQILELADGFFKTAINIFKGAQEKMNILSKQMGSISKEIKQMDILEIKRTYLKLHIYIYIYIYIYM